MRYLKMNGCGNDFVVLDARDEALALTPEQARAIADRVSGIGCDQVIAIERSDRADAFMRIWNADGGEVAACGNAARCVAWRLSAETGRAALALETAAGLLTATRGADDQVTVDMGAPRLGWREIPVARETDTIAMAFAIHGPGGLRLEGPGGVNMGNPHAVFFVPDVAQIPVDTLGPQIERHAFFPERVNAGFAEVRAPDLLRLRVWERGAGLTKACGTGACAALVAGVRKGLLARRARVLVDGGALEIDWREADGHVLMTGPVALEGSGDLIGLA